MRSEILIRQRIWKLMIVLVALFGAIPVRIVSLTVIQGEELTARGVRRWTQEGKVSAQRGSILDSRGDPLVMSTTAYIVSANPRAVADEEAFADALAPLLKVDRDLMIRRLGNKAYASVQLKRQVPRETVDAIRALRAQDDALDQLLQGLAFSEDSRRVYLNGAFLSQVLGLTNVDSVGQSGLEQVVAAGGGHNAYIEGYRVGGKTGTAPVDIDGKVSTAVHIGSFIGFAPVENPRFAVLVTVNAADVPVDYGGTRRLPSPGRSLRIPWNTWAIPGRARTV